MENRKCTGGVLELFSASQGGVRGNLWDQIRLVAVIRRWPLFGGGRT